MELWLFVSYKLQKRQKVSFFDIRITIMMRVKLWNFSLFPATGETGSERDFGFRGTRFFFHPANHFQVGYKSSTERNWMSGCLKTERPIMIMFHELVRVTCICKR